MHHFKAGGRPLLAVVGLLICQQTAAAEWFPLQVERWEPAFNTVRQHRTETYTALAKAAQPWKVCVSLPHMKDSYWTAVTYGLIEEATRLGVALRIYEAGGYDKLDVQRKQLDTCVAEGAKAIIIGAISKDGLNDLVERYVANQHVVVDLINGMGSPKLTARVAADFFEMGQTVGDLIKSRVQGRPARVVWLPGPKGAGWAAAGDAGFMQAVAGSSISVVDSLWGDTGLAAQTKLLTQFLDRNPDIDYVVGNAVAAEAAVQELRRRGLESKVKIVSYYFSSNVYRGIERDRILAAPSDVPTLQSRLALDVAVKALEGKPIPRHISAPLQLIERSRLDRIRLRDSLAPDGFRPIFSVN